MKVNQIGYDLNGNNKKKEAIALKSNQRGYTLIELVMVCLLIALLGSSIQIGNRMLKEVTLKAKVSEVVEGIEYMKQSAVATGNTYALICFENGIWFRRLPNDTYYKIQLGKNITVPADMRGEHFFKFKGTMAPSKGGTLILKDKALGKQARITLGIATGKIRVYYETI